MNAPADPRFAQRCRESYARQKARVIKPARTLTIARAEVYADDGRHIASMQQTLMMLANTPDTPE